MGSDSDAVEQMKDFGTVISILSSLMTKGQDVLHVTPFEKVPLLQLLTDMKSTNETASLGNQLTLL